MCPHDSEPSGESVRQGVDLLRLKWIRGIALSPLFPYVFQAIFLLFFVWLAVLAWSYSTPDGVHDKLYAKTNIVNLLIWGLWWPAMIWAAVWFGRIWCAICPLELVANGAERLGRAVGVRQRRLGKWLRGGALILALYAVSLMLVPGIHLHRIPAYTSVFLWGLLAIAAVSGFVFKDRAFCRGFCPAGLLLGTYGRGAVLAVRRNSSQTCSTCTGKDCMRACSRTRLDARSCPSLLNPAKLNRNVDCLVCGQCFKACRPSNLGLFLRRPFHVADAREPLASWPVTLFVVLVSGFVSYEVCTEWKAAKALFLWVPEHVTDWLQLAAYGGWVQGLWTLFVFPALLWTVLGALILLFRGANTMGEAWRRLALPLAVVIAAGQMAKGLAKITSWGGYLPYALREPDGIQTAVAMTAGTTPKPAVMLSMPIVAAASVVLILVMAYFSLRESRLADRSTHGSRIVPILLVGLTYAFLAFGWGFLS